MTRYTNIGYKRKYLQAGFDNDETPKPLQSNDISHLPSDDQERLQPPAAKKLRVRKGKAARKDVSEAVTELPMTVSKKENEDDENSNAVAGVRAEKLVHEESKPKNLGKKKKKESYKKKLLNESAFLAILLVIR